MKRHIGWKKEVRKPELGSVRFGMPLETEIIDIYVFDDPKIVNYNNGFTGLRPNGNYYEIWERFNDELRKKERYWKLGGQGFKGGCWCEVNEDLKGLAGKIGIEEMELKMILNDGH